MNDHGYAAYSRHKDPCRCDVCKAAKAAYLRAKRASGPNGVIVHGTAHGYKDNGCRCPDCVRAGTAKRVAEKRRQRDREAAP